jgi:uncharacterized protein
MDEQHSLGKEYILTTLREHLDKLQELGALKIGLFGSQVRDDARSDSDIDILVRLKDDRFRTYRDVFDYLESVFEREIDLVPEEDIRPELRDDILGEAIYA